MQLTVVSIAGTYKMVKFSTGISNVKYEGQVNGVLLILVINDSIFLATFKRERSESLKTLHSVFPRPLRPPSAPIVVNRLQK
jgi:hypothetical protein